MADNKHSSTIKAIPLLTKTNYSVWKNCMENMLDVQELRENLIEEDGIPLYNKKGINLIPYVGWGLIWLFSLFFRFSRPICFYYVSGLLLIPMGVFVSFFG